MIDGGDIPVDGQQAAEGMDDGMLLALLEDELSDAEEYTDVLIGDERAKALDYYLGRPMGDEREGRSKTISREVYKVVEGVSTAIANIYASAKSAIEFAPRRAEDVKGAEQRTAAVEYVFYTQNNGFLALLESIKDGVQAKAGFLTWRWEKNRLLTEERYRDQTEESLAMLVQDNPTLQVVSQTPKGMTQGPDGQPVPLFDIVARLTNEKGSCVVEAVPPEEVLVTGRARSANIQKAPTIFWRSYKTRTELLKCGYDADAIDKLSFTTVRTNEAQVERRIDEMSDVTGEALIYTTWIEHDCDDDGIVELRRVVWTDGAILENVITDEINLSSWTPNIQPHEFFGRSPADDAMESQEVMTAIKRQTLDNLYLANNPMWRVDSDDSRVNVSDFYNPEIGKVLRAPKDMAEAITFPFVAQHSFPMLEFEMADTENKTGFTRYAQGMDSKSLNQTARGISIISNMSQQRVQLMARIYGELCLKPALRGIAKLLSQHGEKALAFRLAGKFVEVDPREWKEEYDMTVNVGLGVTDPEQQLLHLQGIEAAQAAAVQGGGMGKLVTPKNLYNLQAKKTELAGFKDASQFWMDPETAPPAGPPPPDPEMVKQQAEMQQRQAELQAKTQADAAKLDADMQFKERDAMRSMELEQFKAQLTAQTQIQIAGIKEQSAAAMQESAQAGESEKFDQHAANSGNLEAMLAQQADVIGQALAAFAQSQHAILAAVSKLSAPKRVLRDESGRAIGVETVEDQQA